jgi:GNAT superfamily N-acetyltransferase
VVEAIRALMVAKRSARHERTQAINQARALIAEIPPGHPRLRRAAQPDLIELALRAKSHWGYGEPFLAAARATLTIDAETISSARVYVAEQDGATVGFYGLTGEPPSGVLEWMFLEPHAIGRGHGRRMWDDAVTRARAAGFSELLIESDRFAEDYYLTMGAVRVAAAASPVDGAPLPLLKIKLASEAG